MLGKHLTANSADTEVLARSEIMIKTLLASCGIHLKPDQITAVISPDRLLSEYRRTLGSLDPDLACWVSTTMLFTNMGEQNSISTYNRTVIDDASSSLP